VIAHADRGSQYTSNDYLDFCQPISSAPRSAAWRRASTVSMMVLLSRRV